MARRRTSPLFCAIITVCVLWFAAVCLFLVGLRRKTDPVDESGVLFVAGDGDGRLRLKQEITKSAAVHPRAAGAVAAAASPVGANELWKRPAQSLLVLAEQGPDMKAPAWDHDPQPHLTPDERDKLVKEGYKDYGFNKFKSDRVALDRSIPDTRNYKCGLRPYAQTLPRCSVIVIFRNEAWSALLRSVISLLRRTPKHLLEEILLVDDHSDKKHLGKPLDDYVAKLPNVRVIRQASRMGLTRSRMAGAREAKGDVLVFLDCHIEANVGWYEPLAARIQADRSNVVCPVIDIINQDSFQYQSVGNAFVMGSFNWNLIFRWQPIPERIRKMDVKDETSEFRSPTMAGGLFAISREYFEHLGKYDYEMDIWGSENLELSFRIWQCGGRLEIAPCSRVGHVYRRQSPISFPSGVDQTTTKNALRLAEVWLDEYKDIYYRLRPDARKREYGDITERVALRKRLQCKSMKWYLDTVYPELYVPDKQRMRAWGEMRNPSTVLCVDTLGKNDGGEPIGVYQCHGMGSNQAFWYTKSRTLRRVDSCAVPRGTQVVLTSCGDDASQKWEHFGKASVFKHVATGKCLDRGTASSGGFLSMSECNPSLPAQVWEFGEYNNDA